MGVRGRPRSIFPRSNGRGRGRGRLMGMGRTVAAPFARGNIYRGPSLKQYNSRRPGMNCTRMVSKTNIGKMQVYSLSSLPTVAFKPNATFDTGGQWFFAPTMSYYWPLGCSTYTMASMYQYFYLKNVWFEFESLYQPGNTANYNIVWSFVENVNLGETTISGYTSVSPLTSAQVLQNQESGSFPAFQAKMKIAPPGRWYRRRYVTRNYSVLGPVVTGSASTTSQNVQTIPFGLWLSVDGPNPTGAIDLARIFVHYDIEFCDLAATQQYNNIGGTTFFDTDIELKEMKIQMVKLTHQLQDLTIPDNKRVIEVDDSPYVRLKQEDLSDVDLNFTGRVLPTPGDSIYRNDRISGFREEIKLTTPKSTSNKSNR